MNYVFVVNPVAGKGGRADSLACEIRDFFAGREENLCIYFSKSPGDATRFVKEYPLSNGEETCFVACGGDGTFYEVVNGAFGRSGVSFAVYPCGSGNDFIKTSGGKKEDYLKFENLINSKIKIFDAIDCNGKICSNLCDIGIDSIVCDRMNRYKKIPGVSGEMAYNISTAVTLSACAFRKSGYPMSITFNDGEKLSGRFMLSVFGNGKVYGGSYHPVPEAELDDGYIDFCAVNEIGLLRLANVIGIYKAGKHAGNPKFNDILHMRRCTSAHIESPAELTVSVDGEIFRSQNIDIKIIPSSLPFHVPANVE